LLEGEPWVCRERRRGRQSDEIQEFIVTSLGDTAELKLKPLVSQLRDALRNAEAELQRRCFISQEIKQALAAANAFLDDQ